MAEKERRMGRIRRGQGVCISGEWENKARICGIVQDKDTSEETVNIKVTDVDIKGWYYLQIHATTCTGNENIRRDDMGIKIWVPLHCID